MEVAQKFMIVSEEKEVLKAIEGIKNLQRYNLPVSTLFTLGKHNVDDLINTIKLNDMLGIEYMSVMVICPTGRANDGSILQIKNIGIQYFYLTKRIARGEFKVKFKIVPPNESDIFGHIIFHWLL